MLWGRHLKAFRAAAACLTLTFQTINTPAPREGQARTAIPAQRWRSPCFLVCYWNNGDYRMSTTDHTKAAGKSGQRGRKAPPRGPKADAQPSPKPEQHKAAKAQAAPVVTSARKAPNGTSAPAQV